MATALLTSASFTALMILALRFPTTGDSGDSVTHYLYSHYAFKHPVNFFHHWAKPVFVLFSSPFSQVGFIGIELFNIFCAVLTALFTAGAARNFGLRNSWLVYVFLFFAPLFLKLVLSGLTEYFFAMLFSMSLLLISRNWYVAALIVVSFLPLARSEGLLILGVFAIHCLAARKLRQLPWLLTGQLFYSVAGAFYHGHIFWVFSKIPYASAGSPYGSGEALDLFFRLNYVIEKPLYALLAAGICFMLYHWLGRRTLRASHPLISVILLTFIVFFTAHSVFWWKGIFNSMGLPRVFIAVMPSIAIIALYAADHAALLIKKESLRVLWIAVVLLVVVIFPFTSRPQGIRYDKEMYYLPDNDLADHEVAPFVKAEFPKYRERTLYYSHPYLSMALDIDPFDPYQFLDLRNYPVGQLSSGSILIWDNWFAPTESGVSLDSMLKDGRLELLRTFRLNYEMRETEFAVFRSR